MENSQGAARLVVVTFPPTPEMIDEAAQRLASFQDGSVWPDSWDVTQVAQMRLLAERALRSGIISGETDDRVLANAPDTHARVEAALTLAVRYGGIDGDHHKAWVIDQMVRALSGDGYRALVEEATFGEDGPGTYEWKEGTAP